VTIPAERQRLLEQLDVRARLEGALPALTSAIEAEHQRAAQVVAQRWAGLGAGN
jgi:hypothetical protein